MIRATASEWRLETAIKPRKSRFRRSASAVSMNRRVTTVPLRKLNKQANIRESVTTEVKISGTMTQPPDFNSCNIVACAQPGDGVVSTACASSGTITRANRFIPINSLFKCTWWRSANLFHSTRSRVAFRAFQHFPVLDGSSNLQQIVQYAARKSCPAYQLEVFQTPA